MNATKGQREATGRSLNFGRSEVPRALEMIPVETREGCPLDLWDSDISWPRLLKAC